LPLQIFFSAKGDLEMGQSSVHKQEIDMSRSRGNRQRAYRAAANNIENTATQKFDEIKDIAEDTFQTLMDRVEEKVDSLISNFRPQPAPPSNPPQSIPIVDFVDEPEGDVEFITDAEVIDEPRQIEKTSTSPDALTVADTIWQKAKPALFVTLLAALAAGVVITIALGGSWFVGAVKNSLKKGE
jgi:hypothetical protein